MGRKKSSEMVRKACFMNIPEHELSMDPTTVHCPYLDVLFDDLLLAEARPAVLDALGVPGLEVTADRSPEQGLAADAVV